MKLPTFSFVIIIPLSSITISSSSNVMNESSAIFSKSSIITPCKIFFSNNDLEVIIFKISSFKCLQFYKVKAILTNLMKIKKEELEFEDILCPAEPLFVFQHLLVIGLFSITIIFFKVYCFCINIQG